jgi:NitT/TauT family transport system substrate-binding protein
MPLSLHAICRKVFHIFLLLAATVPLIHGAGLHAENLKSITFIPQWEPQAQFAGYYVAYEKGFYKAQGLDVRIMRGGPGRPSAEMLAKGAADFATMFLSTGIEERAKGTKLINIAQVVRESNFLLVARKSSGINTPRDMEGKKMGMWGAELRLQPTAFIRRYGVHVKPVPQSYTVNLFLRGGVDIASAMLHNEYHTILSSGVDPEDLVVFKLADYGINFPEDGIYCLEETFRKDPGACYGFARASVQGWLYAFDHPEEALDIVMKYVDEANIATNRCHQKWMLEHMRNAIYFWDSNTPVGELAEFEYADVARELKAGGLIDSIPSYSEFFVDCVGVNEE